MLTDTIAEDPRWDVAGLEDMAEQAACAALAHLGMDAQRHEVAILGCDDTRIAGLNAEFRDKPAATNVLSWPHEDLSAPQDGGSPLVAEAFDLGDIAISYDTCQQEAADLGRPFSDHVCHLVVHGLLHLLGYDHIRDADATLMEQLEREILGNLGLPDPYRNDWGR